jgi:hypothetical protein
MEGKIAGVNFQRTIRMGIEGKMFVGEAEVGICPTWHAHAQRMEVDEA